MNAQSRTSSVHLEPQHLRTVAEVLSKHLPNREVWLFGSRATGVRLKQYSDLDLAVSGQLSVSELGSLMEAFEESLLPMKVDVVALDSVSSEFAERIRRDFLLLQSGSN